MKFVENDKKTAKLSQLIIEFFGKTGTINFFSSFICIFIGILFGFILMVALDPGAALKGLGALLSSGFSNNNQIAYVLYNSVPTMLAGVAIAFCFKLGLFNIGVTGQLTFGAFVGVVCGLSGIPWYICIIFAGIAGMLAGMIIGILKAKFNVNEVLSGIMLNWILYYVIGMLGKTVFNNKSFIDKLEPSYFRVLSGNALLPDMGLSSVLPGMNIGIIIAIVIIITLQVVLNYTVFGFELKMSGLNRDAAKYCGVNQTKSIILALCIAGACAGIGGYIIYANPYYPLKFIYSSDSNSLLGTGFDGISVSLIAQNSPIGCIISAIFLNYIEAASPSLKSASATYNLHYTELINAIIIYTASFSSFMGLLLRKGNRKILENFSRDKDLTEMEGR